LEIHFRVYVDKIYEFILVKRVVTFGYFVGVSFPWKFKLNFQEFKIGWPTKSKKPFIIQPITTGKDGGTTLKRIGRCRLVLYGSVQGAMRSSYKYMKLADSTEWEISPLAKELLGPQKGLCSKEFYLIRF
jgi:hypothetical protein